MVPLQKLSVCTKSAFYRKFHGLNKLALAYKKLLNGVGADMFQPFCKVYDHHKWLRNTNCGTGLIELNTLKRQDDLQKDLHKKFQYHTFAYKTYLLLLQTDCCKQTMRVLFSGMHFSLVLKMKCCLLEIRVLSQPNLVSLIPVNNTSILIKNFIAHMFEKAPNSTENCGLCYEEEKAP